MVVDGRPTSLLRVQRLGIPAVGNLARSRQLRVSLIINRNKLNWCTDWKGTATRLTQSFMSQRKGGGGWRSCAWWKSLFEWRRKKERERRRKTTCETKFPRPNSKKLMWEKAGSAIAVERKKKKTFQTTVGPLLTEQEKLRRSCCFMLYHLFAFDISVVNKRASTMAFR